MTESPNVSTTPGRPARIERRAGTVTEIIAETSHAKTLVLNVPGWPGHLAGQHVDVRLTAEDGYQAQRSYSIASEPSRSTLAITIERLEDGEVSPYLSDALGVGDRVELRGPIGGYFVWDPGTDGPLFLVAGGSGIVPLMAMLRARAAAGPARQAATPATLLYSSRSWDDVFYRDELTRLATTSDVRVVHTLTRTQPPGWPGFKRRIDADMLLEVAPPPSDAPHIYVCGPRRWWRRRRRRSSRSGTTRRESKPSDSGRPDLPDPRVEWRFAEQASPSGAIERSAKHQRQKMRGFKGSEPLIPLDQGL